MSFPLSKHAIDAPPRGQWDLVHCPICDKMVVLHGNETLRGTHYKQVHSKDPYVQLDAPLEKRNLPPLSTGVTYPETGKPSHPNWKEPGMAEIENFKYEPSKLEPKYEG